MRGYLLGACSCDWGCPCSFNARPTKGFCEGGYVWHVTEGEYADVKLDGVTFCWIASSPGPLHEGNVTAQVVIDERATPAQREAILKVSEGKEGGPFAVFAAVTSKFLEPVFARFDVKIDGLHSYAKAGNVLDIEIAPIENPVTGAREQLQLRKPTGFTSTWADLGKSRRFSVRTSGLRYEHTGQYAEYSEFAYTQGVSVSATSA
jgi:hypothetical protein